MAEQRPRYFVYVIFSPVSVDLHFAPIVKNVFVIGFLYIVPHGLTRVRSPVLKPPEKKSNEE